MPENKTNKEYIGDGVYIQEGNIVGGIILTTEDGISVQNEIYLEDEHIIAIVKYCERIWGPRL